MLIRIQCCLTSCWSASIGIKAPTDQETMLYKITLIRISWCNICWSWSSFYTIMLIRLYWLNISCWSGSSVPYHHAYPLFVLKRHLLIGIQCYIASCWSGCSGITSADQDQIFITSCWSGSGVSPADQDPVLYNTVLIRFNWHKGSCCYITSCRSGSSRIYFCIKSCWSG